MTDSSHSKEITELQARIARAQSECDAWRTAGRQELHLEAYTRIEALELQLDWLRARAPAAPEALPAAPVAASSTEGLMAQLSVSYDGRHYQFGQYRYDQVADAIHYAQRHPGEANDARPAAAPIEIPDEAQRALMGSFDISFRDGLYHLGDYRYERLADAVAYARLRRVQGAASRPDGVLAGRVDEGVARELPFPRFVDRDEPQAGGVRPLQEIHRRQE